MTGIITKIHAGAGAAATEGPTQGQALQCECWHTPAHCSACGAQHQSSELWVASMHVWPCRTPQSSCSGDATPRVRGAATHTCPHIDTSSACWREGKNGEKGRCTTKNAGSGSVARYNDILNNMLMIMAQCFCDTKKERRTLPKPPAAGLLRHPTRWVEGAWWLVGHPYRDCHLSFLSARVLTAKKKKM